MKKILFLLSLASAALCARADELKLTNRKADELCGAALRIGPGLSGVNMLRLARAINTLRPIAEAYAAGINAERENRKIGATTKPDSPEWAAFLAACEKLGNEPVKVDLALLNKLTDDEANRLAESYGGRGNLPVSTDPAALGTVLSYLERAK